MVAVDNVDVDPDEGADVEVMPPRPAWRYGVNDQVPPPSSDQAGVFSATGDFCADFRSLCNVRGIVAPGVFLPSRCGEFSEPSTINVQSLLIDGPTVAVLQHVLTTAKTLTTLRLSGCMLDAEQLNLLKSGFTELSCVTTLHLDWNPLELPHNDLAAVASAITEGSMADLDEIERLRDAKQCERRLLYFRKRIEARCGDFVAAYHAALEAADPLYPATAAEVPLTRSDFTHLCNEYLCTTREESENLFDLLDSIRFGSCDNAVPLCRIEETFAEVQQIFENVPDDHVDELGSVLAGLLEKPLEIISLRSCEIGVLELPAIAKTLGTYAPNLRALNLWGNFITDKGTELLNNALTTNFGLECLGLGCNVITHVGLTNLCKPLGVNRITEKAEADAINKANKELVKEKEKKAKGFAPKYDGNMRQRYTPALYTPILEEFKDPSTNEVYWLYTRNLICQNLTLDRNPISDAEAVWNLRPFGCGNILLRGTPCAEKLREKMIAAAATPAEAESTEDPLDQEAGSSPFPFKGAAAAVTGWNFIMD